MGHFLWCTGIGAYAIYNEIIKFSEKVGIGFGLYAVDSHSNLSDYYPLAAYQNSWINFRSRHDGLALNWWTPRISVKSARRCLMTKPKRYKRYSAEFKREAILRARPSGTLQTYATENLSSASDTFSWQFTSTPSLGGVYNL